MKIVVNTHNLNTDYFSASLNYCIAGLIELARLHPTHQFVLITEAVGKNNHDPLPNNCSLVYLPFVFSNNLKRLYYIRYSLPALLKKLKPDLFISLNGMIVKSLAVPQFIFLDHSFTSSIGVKGVRFAEKQFIRSLGQVAKIITPFATLKLSLVKDYNIDPFTIETIPLLSGPQFAPLFWEKKEEIKINLSDGKDFFFTDAIFPSVDHFIQLLKAFTGFKKWQKSNMQWIIYTAANKDLKLLQQALSSYKFKADVQLLTNLSVDKYASLIAAAYAFIYPHFISHIPVAVIRALYCQVPAITTNTEANRSFFGDAVEYVDTNNVTALSDKLILLYKDEAYRNQILEKGIKFCTHNNDNDTLEKYWNVLTGNTNVNGK